MASDKDKDPMKALKVAIGDAISAFDADIYLYSGVIGDEGVSKLRELVHRFGKRPNCVLYLTTPGGDPDEAYRMARCLQRKHQDGKFVLYVETFCKSAGTLIAIGADQILMSESAELGPLDVQLLKPDTLLERTSGLTPKQALSTLRERAFETLEETFLELRFKSGLQITTRTALQVASELTTGLYGRIYEQIDPMRLGEISRAMTIAEKYGTRLAEVKSSLLGDESLKRLIEDYPSHGYVIDREEAAEIFSDVSEPPAELAHLAKFMAPGLEQGMKQRNPVVEFISALAHNEQSESQNEHGESPDDAGAIQEVAGDPNQGTVPENSEEIGGQPATNGNLHPGQTPEEIGNLN